MRFIRQDHSENHDDAGLAALHRLASGIADLVPLILGEHEPDDALRQVVAQIGKAAGVGSACLIVLKQTDDHDDLVLKVRHGWVAQDATAQLTIGTLDGSTLNALGLSRWKEVLLAGEPALRLDEEERAGLLQRGISGLAAFPIVWDRHLWGALLLIDALHEIKLAAGQVDMLGIAVSFVEAILERTQEKQRPTDSHDGRLRALVEHLATSVSVVDRSGRVLFSGGGGSCLLSINLDGAHSEPVYDRIHPDDVERVRAAIEPVIRGEAARSRVSYRLRDETDEWRNIETTATDLTEDPLVAGILLKSNDVTDQVRAEQSLQSTASLLKAVAESASLLFSRHDAEPPLEDVLARLGEATQVSSVRLFEVHADPATGEPLVSNRATWVSPVRHDGLAGPRYQSQSIKGSGFEHWYQELLDGIVIEGPVGVRPEPEREMLHREGVRSVLSIPIFIDGRLWGDITFVNRDFERRWLDDEIAILRLAATNIAETLARYRSDDELERRRSLLTAVVDISAALLVTDDLENALQQTVDILGETTGVSRATVYQFHPHPETGRTAGTKLVEWTAAGIASRMKLPEVKSTPCEGNPVLHEWYQALVADEIFGGVTHRLDEPLRSFLQGYNVRSILLTPIRAQDGSWGFLGLYDEVRDREWTEDEQAILRTAGSIIASSIDRRRIQRSLQYRGVLLNAVAEASVQLLSQEDFAEGLQQAAEIIGRAADVSRVTIYEFHPHPETGLIAATKRVEWAAPETVPRIGLPEVENVPFEGDEALDGWYQALTCGENVGGNVRQFPEPTRSFFADFNVRSIFVMPIMTERGAWGYIGIDDDANDREWSADEQAILRTAASIIAGAIDRRRADAALRASDARFRSMIQNASDVILLIDRDGRLTYISASVAPAFGYEPDELVGEIPFTIIHPDDHVSVREHLRQLLEDGISSTRNEFRVLHADGSWRNVETVASNLLEDPHVEGIVVTARDFTERTQAQHDLERKSELLQAVAEATSALLIHTDLDQGITSTLERIGTAAQASRAAIFRFHPHPESGLVVASKRYEWTAPDIPQRMDESVRNLPFEGGRFDAWYQAFKRGETVSGYVDEFPQPIRDHFKRFGVRSLLLMPMIIDDRPEGFIVLDDETRDHFWNDDEQAILRASASAIAGAIARRLSDEALQRSEERFRAMIQHSSDIIALLDETGIVRYISPSVERVLGLDPGDITGHDSRDLIHADSLPRWSQTLHDVAAEPPGTSRQIDIRYQTNGGDTRTLEIVVTNHLNDPRVNALIVNARDITERKQLEERLSWQAFHDPLTELANRSLFLIRLEHVNARTQRRSESFAVLFIDLDRFKIINDSLGHAAGDELLIILARRLQRVLRPSDTISRFGGDEFTVLLEDLGDRGDVTVIVERIADVLREPMILPGGQEVAVNASIGVALSTPRERPTPADLLRNADIALYRAKANGRGRWEIYDHEMNAMVIERHRLETEIRRAIDRGELSIWYQPEIALHTRALSSLEALVRWNHPQHGILQPSEFIVVAEETGLVVPLGRWVLRQSCVHFQQWREQGLLPESATLSVNLSATEFGQPDLVDEVRAILEETGLAASLLRLEITESAVIREIAATLTILEELHELGVQFVIDDFGTGYSSLGYLSQLPIDVLKIARSFISASEDDRNLAIINAVATLAHGLGMSVTAEGIETEAQLQRILSATPCDFGQGFYFAHPIEAANVPRMLASETLGRLRT